MKYCHAGMCQGVVLPRKTQSYIGASTHGIDSCTGLAMVTQKHIFVAHMPPPPVENNALLAWREQYKNIIDQALAKMPGQIEQSIIVSPNTEKEFPNGGPTLVRNTLEILYGVKTERALGNTIKISSINGQVDVSSGSLAEDKISRPNGGSEKAWQLHVFQN